MVNVTELNRGPDISANAIDAATVSADEATISEQLSMGANRIDLYLSSTGDDSNTGLSSSEALATFSEAVDRVSKVSHGLDSDGAYTVRINLESGATFSVGNQTIDHPQIGQLNIEGDGGVSTIESSGSSYGLNITMSRVRLDNITVQPADSSNPYQRGVILQYGSVLGTGSNVTIKDGTYGSLVARRNCYGLLDDCDLEAGSGTDNGAVSVYNSHLVFTSSANITGGYNIGFNVDDNSGGGFGGTVDGSGTAIRTQDNSHVKVNGATIQNATTAFNPTDGGSIKRTGGTTLSSVTDEIPDTFEGNYIDLDNGERIINGFRELQSGTVSLTSGGAARVNSGARVNPGNRVYVDWGVANPSGPCSVEVDQYYDGSSVAFRFLETAGNNATDVTYRVWEDVRP
jgi:hypothetical protein